MKITRTKDRIKQTSEVFTPLPLVDEILSKLPEEVWQPDQTFIDPACGDGNFLVRVIAWKIWKGSPLDVAVITTCGVDLMEDNVSHARGRVLTAAFAAWKWHYDNGFATVSPHLSIEDERIAGMQPGHDDFGRLLNPTAVKNIVHHDALTYCYRFGDPEEEPREGSNCTCELCANEKARTLNE